MLLRRRLLLMFVGIVAGVLALGVLMVVSLRDRDDAQQRERRLTVAVERVAQLSTAYSDQETGERGFVLSGGDERFLRPYQDGRAAAQHLGGQLRTVADTPELRRSLAAVTTAAARWQREAAGPEIALARSGDSAAAAARVAQGAGKGRFDAVRASLSRLDGRLQAEAASARSRLDGVRDRLVGVFAAIVALAIIGALLAAWLIRKWVTRPIDLLSDEVRRVRTGALDSPIRIDGPPELAALALDIDAMRGRIRQQLLESERSREAVEQSAAVVLTLRSELEPVPSVPDGWTVAGQLRAAEGVVAGDCYDLFLTRAGELALVVVDIAGHGATEGILALRCKEVLRTALVSGAEPGDALGTTAEMLGDMGDEVFLTAFVAVIGTADGRIRYANAGHPPAFVVGDGTVVSLEPTGPLMGLLEPGWKTAEAEMAAGDNLCAYTDGLLETRNAANEFFGPERLVSLLEGARCDEAPAVVKRCIDEVELFSPDGLRDDATIVVLCRSG